MGTKHSFAKVWLNALGNEIIINGKNYFSYDINKLKKRFKIKPLKTFIKVGHSLLEDDDLSEVIEISYNDLRKNLGLAVYRVPAGDKGWRKNQRNIFYIGMKTSSQLAVSDGAIRKMKHLGKCKILWDRLNKRVQIIGEDFGTKDGAYGTGMSTPWYEYSRVRKKEHIISSKYDIESMYSSEYIDSISQSIEDRDMGLDDENAPVLELNDLPVMITSEGYLLCFPKPEKHQPLYRMLIVGKSGRGKSYTLNSLIGRIHYIFRHRVGLLNDSLNQFYDLMLPCPDKQFIQILDIIGNEPLYLPVINLYMSCPNVEIKYKDENVGYRLVVSFNEFLRGYKHWTYGIKKWDLGGAESYMTARVIDEIKGCTSSIDIRKVLYNVIETETTDDKGKVKKKEGMIQMIEKWHPKFESIFREEFTSNLFHHEPDTSPYWTLKKKNGEIHTGHPFMISIEAGLVPVINNSLAKDYSIAKKHMSNLLKQSVKWQVRKGRENQLKVWLGVDELKDFLGKKGDELYQALDYVFTQGRVNNLGFIGNVQEYNKLSESMRANSTHLFIFELQTDSERRAVAKDYSLDKDKLSEMANLKLFETLLVTKEKVVLYKDGKREMMPEGGMWKGKVLPPITCHKSV